MYKETVHRLTMARFWALSLWTMVYNIWKLRTWNMASVDFDMGVDGKGRPLRKRLTAKRSGSGSYDLYWFSNEPYLKWFDERDNKNPQ